MHNQCETLSSEIVFRGARFEIAADMVRLPSSKVVRHDTVLHPGAVVIVARLDEERLLVINQYRQSIRESILEFPAGTLEDGEEPLACARRELIEETGYEASTWEPLGRLYPTPGFCNEIQHLFFAKDLKPNLSPGDEDEIINVCPLQVTEIESAIREDRLRDAKTIAAFMRARLAGLV